MRADGRMNRRLLAHPVSRDGTGACSREASGACSVARACARVRARAPTATRVRLVQLEAVAVVVVQTDVALGTSHTTLLKTSDCRLLQALHAILNRVVRRADEVDGLHERLVGRDRSHREAFQLARALLVVLSNRPAQLGELDRAPRCWIGVRWQRDHSSIGRSVRPVRCVQMSQVADARHEIVEQDRNVRQLDHSCVRYVLPQKVIRGVCLQLNFECLDMKGDVLVFGPITRSPRFSLPIRIRIRITMQPEVTNL